MMILVFRRTGQRRYAVEAQREGFPDVVMNPAPGYDPLMPHDLMHLVVEAQLGLAGGIFGQLAAGGDAGTFHIPAQPAANSRQLARARKRVSVRGKKLLSGGRDDCAQSERATFICWQAWLARSSSLEAQQRSQTMAQQAREVRDTASGKEQRVLNERRLEEICEHLDQLSAHWSRLRIGESMSVAWPDLSIVSQATC